MNLHKEAILSWARRAWRPARERAILYSSRAADRVYAASRDRLPLGSAPVAARLRMGIGILLGSIVLLGLIFLLETRFISADVRGLVALKDPKADAVYGMRINLIGESSALLGYLQDRGGGDMRRLEECREKFGKFYGRYMDFARTDEEKASARALGRAFWAFSYKVGRLVRLEDRKQESELSFRRRMDVLDALLDMEAKKESGSTHWLVSRTLQEATELEILSRAIRRGLALYASDPNKARERELLRLRRGFDRHLTGFESLALSGEEEAWARRSRRAFKRAWASARAAIALSKEEQSEQSGFRVLRGNLSGILDDQIQAPLQKSRLETRDELQSRMARMGFVVAFLVLGAILFGLAVGVVLARSITEPVDSLMKGMEAAGRGDLDSRVEVRSQDELGRLAGAFNGMLGELRRSRDELVAEIDERRRTERALRQKSQELERSNKELEDFAYVSSHDLQEPLRKMTNYTELLERRCKGKLGPEIEELIAPIVGGARRMRVLIRDLLAYSRIGRELLAPEAADMNSALREALADLAAAVKESQAAVTADALPTLLAHGAQMRSLFQNLIGNALKFRGPDPPRVHVSARREGGAWRFAVKDNGIGIESAYLKRVFDVFERLHGQAKYPGTGIGLAICKKIVDRHGGRIWVESTPGKGSTFYFTLPAGKEGDGR